jgi:CRISPR-associated protein Cas5d
MGTHILELAGDYACFTRPEMKVERVSYDVITPSAARAAFEAILWKPGIRWRITKIEVLRPVRWISVRRNEVGAKLSVSNAQTAMNRGQGNLALYVEEERQQRAGLFLRDVVYRLHAEMEFTSDEARANPVKYREMFERRADKGQCVNQPYLGCREFAARFRRVSNLTAEPAPISETYDLGWMLYDMDFSDAVDPQPKFFRARMQSGVINLETAEVRG